MHDSNTTLELWEQYIGLLGPKPLRQFIRATENPINEFVNAFVWPYLVVEPEGRPEENSYLCISNIREEWGRGQQNAVDVRALGYEGFLGLQPDFTYFTNPMLFGEVCHGADGKLKMTGPSTRNWGGQPYCYTVEFDVKSIDFLNEQFSWCRSPGKSDLDAPIGKIFRHYSQYVDFMGVNACWSGNKSLHIHLLFDSWMVVEKFGLDRRAMRSGFAQHWYEVERVCREILNVPEDIKADPLLRFPEWFRRLPWGSRLVDWDKGPHLLGIPAGIRVPQVTLWENIRGRRGDGSGEPFHRPGPFIETTEQRQRRMSHGIGGVKSAGPLSDDQRAYCENRLRQWYADRCEWPRLDHLAYESGRWVAHFRNSEADGNPSSIMREDYARILASGRDAHKLNPPRLPHPLGAMMRFWLDRFRRMTEQDEKPAVPAEDLVCCVDADDLNQRELSAVEREFQEQAVSKAVVGDLTRRAILKTVLTHDFNVLKGPEGGGKTRGFMHVWNRLMPAMPAEFQLGMFSFNAYDLAYQKAAEFNAIQGHRGFHAVVITGWERVYKRVCRGMGVRAFTREDAFAHGYDSMFEFVIDNHPEAIGGLKAEHTAMWEAVGTGKPVLLTQHSVMENWATNSMTRVFWHRDFWKRGVEDRQELKDEMRLGVAVHDEVSAGCLLEAHRTQAVDWVRGMIAANPEWRKADMGTAALHSIYRAWKDGQGVPVFDGREIEGVDFEGVRRIANDDRGAWEEFAVEDHGEYRSDRDPEFDIYRKRVGNTWQVRPAGWWNSLARKVVVLTTEALPTLIASKLPEARALGQEGKSRWEITELETPLLDRDTVTVEFARDCTAKRVGDVIRRFREQKGQGCVVVSNSASHVQDVVNHVKARGSNNWIGRDVMQTMMHMHPDLYERHEIYNSWTETDVCCRLAHVDDFNQAAGRNIGFRREGNPQHWLVLSPSLWLKLDDLLVKYSRYDFCLRLDQDEIRVLRRKRSDESRAAA